MKEKINKLYVNNCYKVSLKPKVRLKNADLKNIRKNNCIGNKAGAIRKK